MSLSTREILEQAHEQLLPVELEGQKIRRWVQNDWNSVEMYGPQATEVQLACSMGAMRLAVHLNASAFDLGLQDASDIEDEVIDYMTLDPAFRQAVVLLHEALKEGWPRWHREYCEPTVYELWNVTAEKFMVAVVTTFNDDKKIKFRHIERLFEAAIKKAVGLEEKV